MGPGIGQPLADSTAKSSTDRDYANYLVGYATGLPAQSERIDIPIADEQVIRVRGLILPVVIESGKKTSSGRQQKLHIGCCIPTRDSSRLNLSQIAASGGPVKPGANLILVREVDAIRILIGDQSVRECVSA